MPYIDRCAILPINSLAYTTFSILKTNDGRTFIMKSSVICAIYVI